MEVHFKKEEPIMQHDFPEYKAHKEEHSYVTQEAYDLYMKYKKGDQSIAFNTGAGLKPNVLLAQNKQNKISRFIVLKKSNSIVNLSSHHCLFPSCLSNGIKIQRKSKL